MLALYMVVELLSSITDYRLQNIVVDLQLDGYRILSIYSLMVTE